MYATEVTGQEGAGIAKKHTGVRHREYDQRKGRKAGKDEEDSKRG